MFSQNVIVAFTAFLAVTNAHVKMASPVPFNKDTLDTSPISKAQFPCKRMSGQPLTISQMNNMAVGTKQKLELSGSAVHGGGSCQLSVTLDTEPTVNSVFKVIKSMEGGCPGVDSQANSYDFELPASIPNGKATFAWTWFSKLSGVPELYMNCAPIDVTGGASDKTAFDTLPDMLVANIDKSCESVPNFSVAFPNPGQEVVKGAADDQKPPVGSACGSSSGGGGGDATPAQPSPPAGQPSPAPQSSAAPKPSSPAEGQPAPAPKPSAPPANPGGIFAPGASSIAAVPTLTSTTLVTVTAAPTPAKPAPSGAVPAPPAAPAPPASGNSCSTPGAVVCNGEKQFGLCNNGAVVWQEVAAGTACVNGVISKRSVVARRPRYPGPCV